MIHVELHRHSRWSMLDGSGDGDVWAARAVELGMPALALTDHGTIAGLLEHIAACHKAGIIPINGCEVYFKDSRMVKEGPRFHLTLIAMNYDGWVSLQQLTSESYASGFFQNEGSIGYKAHVDWDLLARHSKGIYCISGCFGGMLSHLLQKGYEPDVLLHIQRMRSVYGDNFSLEIQHHDFDGQRKVNLDTYRIAYETGTPMTACGDPHYPFQSWSNMNDTMFMLASKTSNLKRLKKEAEGDDIYTMKQDNPTLYLMSGAEKIAAYQQFHPYMPINVVQAAVGHSGEIVSRFTPFLLDRGIKMPPLTRRIISKIDQWSIDYVASIEGSNPEWLDEVDDQLVKDTLRRWTYDGLEELKALYPPEHWLKHPFQQYLDDIEHEFEVFDAIGIHVWRYMTMAAGEVRWARQNGVIVGPGRGSVAGSRVAYCSGVTDIDPIPYNLMFERFINVNRKGMPDVDIDFMPGPEGRDKVKGHTAWVYGEENVVDIAAFGTYGPRKAIQDVCRVYDDEIDFQSADRVRKAIELKPTDKMDLDECAEKFPELMEFKNLFPFLFDVAKRIEKAPYSYSKHASGVLIKPAGTQIATAAKYNKDTKGYDKITAWSDTRELLANFGWLKLDYLVIDGLVRQHEIMRALREREDTIVDLRTLPVRWDPYATDPEVMEGFHRAATLGVWQLEGKGTVPVLKAVHPDNMHDLAAVNALIRPGSREAGDTELYAKIKSGQMPMTFWHDAVEEVLRPTYGLMIYQEQVMEVAVQLGGFTRTEADDLRKAMGKKYREGMAVVKSYLRDLGYEEKFLNNASKMVGEEVAIEIWDKTLAKGGYSFNASHAYAYALISYHDMALKTLAPADFYAWLLTFTKSDNMAEKLAATMREGARFHISIKPPDINQSERNFKVLDRQTILYGLASIKNVGPVVQDEIFSKRPYFNYEDFCARVTAQRCNKNAKESLVGVGAFDYFGLRAHLDDWQKAELEETYMGMRVSGESALQKYAELIEQSIYTEGEFDEAPHRTFLCVGGEITGLKPVKDKNGNSMGFINLAFGTDVYRVTMFSDTWARYHEQMQVGKVFLFQGLKDISERYGHGFVATEAISIEEWAMMKIQQPSAA